MEMYKLDRYKQETGQEIINLEGVLANKVAKMTATHKGWKAK